MDVKNISRILIPALLGILLFVNSFHKTESGHEEIERGFEPWVFRSVLDWRARMVTLALDDEFWLAYDAQYASIYKVWQDGVNFDGPVYTMAHGPQPLSVGPAWFQSPYRNPWFVLKEGDSLSYQVQFRGHEFAHHGNEAILNYELILEDGSRIGIEESPELKRHEDGYLGLERRFKTRGVPNGVEIWQYIHMNSLISPASFRYDDKIEIDSTFREIHPGMESHGIYGKMKFPSNGTAAFLGWMHPTPMLKVIEETAEETETAEHPGSLLINRSDCQTCHNEVSKAVGPSYTAIAERYNFTNYFVSKLANKIINGGYGVWGSAAMVAHPELTIDQAKQMVSYIMTLDGESPPKSESGSAQENETGFSLFEDPKPSSEGEGAIVHIYKLPEGIMALEGFKPSGQPHYVGRVHAIHALNSKDFADPDGKLALENNFYVEFQGYLNIKKSDNYLFKLTSDDGSRLFIDEKLIVDNDGLHGYDPLEGEIALSAGKHPYKISFFQAGGGKAVSLHYLKHGGSKFELVDGSMLSYDSTFVVESRPYIPKSKIEKAIPGDKIALQEVHPSFDLEEIRPDGFEPKVGGMDFLSDGRMVVSTWDPAGSIYLLENVIGNKDPEKVKVKRIASGLAEPLGLKIVEDTIYVLQKQELTKLIDHDGDDRIDEYYTLCNSWNVSSNFHEFAFGLAYKDGDFYGALATAIEPGGKSTYPQIQDRGKAIKINRQSGEMDFVAHGLRTPNGIGLSSNKEVFIADNQGDWLPASKIVHLQQDHFYGSRSVNFEKTASLRETPPLVWLPQDEIGNSPSQPIWLNIGPYKNQLLHGEVTHGGLKRTFMEKVDGQYQGCVFRFSQGLEAGVNRVVWGPDGALYVGGVGNPGNWSHTGRKWYGLQRLAYNGKTAFEMLAVRAKTDGMEIEFTEALPEGVGFDPSSYDVQQWYYQPTENYGGPKLGLENLPIQSVNISQDRKRVFLELRGMKAGHLVYIHLNKSFVSTNDKELWTTETWYTLNNIPQNTFGFKSNQPQAVNLPNTLTDLEKRMGWRLLFDGKSMENWKSFKKDGVGSSWTIEDNSIHAKKDPAKERILDGGDLVSVSQYENFELRLDWKIAKGGNSGIMFMVQDKEPFSYTWQSGPEMQILDNVFHPNGGYDKFRAGDMFDIIPSKYVAVNPTGEWNEVRLIHNNGHIEQWLNGRKIVEVDMESEAWKEALANSRFKDMEGFARNPVGHIALQEHGDEVWFRNIKVKDLGRE